MKMNVDRRSQAPITNLIGITVIAPRKNLSLFHFLISFLLKAGNCESIFSLLLIRGYSCFQHQLKTIAPIRTLTTAASNNKLTI